MTAQRKLYSETQAARTLLANYRVILGDDEQAKADTVEGATSLHEAIDTAIARVLEIQTLKAGIFATLELLKTRADRLSTQELGIRTAILEAMSVGALSRLETPLATITRKATPQSVVISDFDKIPAAFLKMQPPALDRAGLLRALKAGETCPGAALSNGGETVAIKWS